jgi:hypothetical protein
MSTANDSTCSRSIEWRRTRGLTTRSKCDRRDSSRRFVVTASTYDSIVTASSRTTSAAAVRDTRRTGRAVGPTNWTLRRPRISGSSFEQRRCAPTSMWSALRCPSSSLWDGSVDELRRAMTATAYRRPPTPMRRRNPSVGAPENVDSVVKELLPDRDQAARTAGVAGGARVCLPVSGWGGLRIQPWVFKRWWCAHNQPRLCNAVGPRFAWSRW